MALSIVGQVFGKSAVHPDHPEERPNDIEDDEYDRTQESGDNVLRTSI